MRLHTPISMYALRIGGWLEFVFDFFIGIYALCTDELQTFCVRGRSQERVTCGD